MSRPHRRRVERNAGAFLSPVGVIPVRMRTLSDDLDDSAAEPEEEREPEIAPPNALQRAVNHLPPPWPARWRAIQAHPGWVIMVAVVVGYLVLVVLRGPVTV